MKAPKCPLCGKEEWRHVCNPRAETKDIRPHPVVTITTPLSHAGKGASTSFSNEGHASGPASRGFDRTKYQREYMRKWRAEKKV